MNVAMCSVLKPIDLWARLKSDRERSPAPTSSESDRAICPTTNAFRVRCPAAEVAPLPSRRAGVRLIRVPCHAGATVEIRTPRAARAAAKPNTRASSVKARSCWVESPGMERTKRRPKTTATPRPLMSPSPASTMPSTNSSRTSLARVPPSERRTAISFRRFVARVSSRFAMLRQPIMRTRNAVASRTLVGASSDSRVPEAPAPPGRRTRFFFTKRARQSASFRVMALTSSARI